MLKSRISQLIMIMILLCHLVVQIIISKVNKMERDKPKLSFQDFLSMPFINE